MVNPLVSFSPSIDAGAAGISFKSRVANGKSVSKAARAQAARPARAAAVVSPRCADLEPDNISVLVAGGGGVAMDVVRQITAAGSWVTVLQRKEDFRSVGAVRAPPRLESAPGFKTST